MSYQTITSDITDDKAVIRLNRPDKYNALNGLMRAELADAVRKAATDARVIVLTGNGPAFCSGQDLSDSGSLDNPDLERVLRDEYQPLVRAIVEAPVPVIAAVNGAAAGAGANIALSCDVVIATESAYFLQAFSKIALMPDAGGTYWLPRSVGSPKAMGAALFAEKISARDADAWGMIWEAVPDEEFEARWTARADYLAKGPTLAFGQIKETIRQSWSNGLDAQLDIEGRSQNVCGQSRDFKEGVLAFIEKRPARFEGR
ncbi:enoyl-CoA hydratase/isomerase family protein [Pseudooceanicola batsensis HTCC2597]|uniref:Enoyl-CoA hydratase/isomerase family protein n=1 Tax=Pseudooceanicola batsensis (strain ATCC BAA-863 / DSM 15984 / KCTC 12145 / HTCC2597) TaxID=252305 RepID=A3U2W9_PSEBH|nr:enoyl-CoA hydratase-related protein [Pseudooceanicola batsensis]EAQ01499.1 enoyl-CoA hydratase/isomerase family protein [Pseudooceanicola batsensis HTCC2597]